MKLFYSPFHTFVHKVLVTAHECGHWDQLERVATFPFKNNQGEDCGDSYDISPLNPLDKVPTLVTDDGQVIFSSQAICEYLDSTSVARKMYPAPGPKRWDALRRLSLSDTIFESTVQMVMEQWSGRCWQRSSIEAGMVAEVRLDHCWRRQMALTQCCGWQWRRSSMVSSAAEGTCHG